MIIQQFSWVTTLTSPEEARRPFYYYGLQRKRQECDGGSLYGKVRAKRNVVHVKRCRINRVKDRGYYWIFDDGPILLLGSAPAQALQCFRGVRRSLVCVRVRVRGQLKSP